MTARKYKKNSNYQSNPLEQTNEQKLKSAAYWKASSTATAIRLIQSNPKSSLLRSYWNTLSCSNRYELDQETGKMKTRKCRNRWCAKCARQRTAKLMTQYSEEISKIPDVKHVVLTQRAVYPSAINERVRETIDAWRTIMKNGQKNRKMYGIRKHENVIAKNHPDKLHVHFHVVINGQENAEWLIDQWVKHWKKAYPKDKGIISRKAQEIIDWSGFNNKAKGIELFKYLTPMVHSHKEKDGETVPKHDNPVMLDKIFESFRGVRSIQPFGGLKAKKITSEDKEKLMNAAAILPPEGTHSEVFEYYNTVFDWVSESGELLTGFKPTIKQKKFFNDIGV